MARRKLRKLIETSQQETNGIEAQHQSIEGSNDLHNQPIEEDQGQESEGPSQGLENQHQSIEEPDSIPPPVKKARGPTLMADIWNQSSREKTIVEWNSIYQPIGDVACTLSTFIGTIARNSQLCSLAYSDWRLFPDGEKEKLLNIVKEKFTVPVHRDASSWILKKIGILWSNHKADLRSEHFYKNNGNVATTLEDKPEHVPIDQWVALVTQWASEKNKKRSLVNRENRNKQIMVHTSGAKSFARVAAEEKAKYDDGREPTRAHTFLLTHIERKTVLNSVDEKSKQAVELIQSKLSELPNSQEFSQDGRVAWQGDVYSQVMNEVIGPERMGRVRGVGQGPSKKYLGSSTSGSTETSCAGYAERSRELELQGEKVRKLEAEVVELRGTQSHFENIVSLMSEAIGINIPLHFNQALDASSIPGMRRNASTTITPESNRMREPRESNGEQN